MVIGRGAFLSHHNNSIAVGSGGDIIILNAITGSQSGVLSGHTDFVCCVVFSSDGTSIISGSNDKTVKLWDVQTGGIVNTFFGHKRSVNSVSISADSATIGSTSKDKTIRLWNVRTGGCPFTIRLRDFVSDIMLPPTDPQCLMYISNKKVWQWGTDGYQIRPPFPFDCNNCVILSSDTTAFSSDATAFSSDGAWFVSCCKKTVTVYNSSSGAIVTEFQTIDDAQSCCFSPSNGLVAVAVDKIVYCWDITTSKPQLVETFLGHTSMVNSLMFSSSTTLISGCCDKLVKFWQIGAQSTDPVLTALKPAPVASASIKSVTLQSKEGIVIIYDSDAVIKILDVSTGICKTSFQTPAKASHEWHKWDTQLIDGRLIFVWSIDNKIHAWDGENRELLWEMDVPWDDVDDLKISGDGSWVFGVCDTLFWAQSLQTGEVMEVMNYGCHEIVGTLIVDGSKVWACWNKSRSIGWDFGIPGSNNKGWDFGIPGSTPIELSTPPSSSKLWDYKQARIKNPVTGEVVFQLSGIFADPVSAQCDDSYLVVECISGEILILDLTNVK